MAKTFYTYEKRQKELAKQKKKEEKRLRRIELKKQKENPELNTEQDLQDSESESSGPDGAA